VNKLQPKKIYALEITGSLTGFPPESGCVLEKYLSMVARLGGRVSSENRIMHNAEPKTIGTTVM
jgi:hypothetical protein